MKTQKVFIVSMNLLLNDKTLTTIDIILKLSSLFCKM